MHRGGILLPRGKPVSLSAGPNFTGEGMGLVGEKEGKTSQQGVWPKKELFSKGELGPFRRGPI
jgi:hypothetical protein